MESYKCQCIKCGHTLTSKKHCNEIECPECGGTMRRTERPGPGQKTPPKEQLMAILTTEYNYTEERAEARADELISELIAQEKENQSNLEEQVKAKARAKLKVL